ncbi:MAG: alanine racemase, partial [Bdellovibrionales bacterium]
YVESSLTPVVGSAVDVEILKNLSKTDLKKIEKVHIKFDLGMSRFGFDMKDSVQVWGALKNLGLSIQGVCGHFPQSEDFAEVNGSSQDLLADLVSCASNLGVPEDRVHAPNSEAISRGKFKVGLRPGLGLYGVSQSREAGIEGVLRLTSPLVSINSLSPGARVSYGGTWAAKEQIRVGVLPIGYADGLRRGLSNRIKFFSRGLVYSQVGTICMDYCMVNLGKTEDFVKGTEFVLFDETYTSLFEWAKLLGTIPYELLTGLGERVERKAV